MDNFMWVARTKIALTPDTNGLGGLIGILLLVSLTLCGRAAIAKDLGVFGNVYEIKEQDAFEWISKRLNHLQESGEIIKQQESMRNKALKSINSPRTFKLLKRTNKPKKFKLNLSFVLIHDIADAEGKVIFPKGTQVNPLDYHHSYKALIFLDGDDGSQVDWALKEHNRRGNLVKLVLTNGSIIELMQQTNKRFYFDQAGKLIEYFQISQVPAIVEQVGNQLQISEVKI